MQQKSNTQVKHWHKLDNTANLFPVVTSKKFTNVYRMAAVLDEQINPELLSKALLHVLPLFPAFNVRMRHGLFWHYMEANDETPQVKEEDDYPCRYIDSRQNDNFLFRVSYYKKRINLETFHVLTDATGSLQFLLAICCRYLILAKPQNFTAEQANRNWFSEHANQVQDRYLENYEPVKKSKYRIGRGYKIKGDRNVVGSLGMIHAHVCAKDIIDLCHAKEVSVTQYLCACNLWGIYEAQLKKKPNKRPVNMFMPVNLRGIFNSKSALNFFSNIYVSYLFSKPNVEFEDILNDVKAQFSEKINKEQIQSKISYTVGSGYSNVVRVVPLPIKKAILRMIYEMSNKSSTLGFSNMGVVKVPPPFDESIKGFDFLFSPSPREPLKIGSISYGDTLTLSFSSTLRNVEIQKSIIKKLTGDGLFVAVESNGVDYETL